MPLFSYARVLRKNPDATAYFAGMLILLGAGINDAVVGSARYSMPYVLDAAFIITVNVIGFVLVRRFVQGAHRLEALSTRLEALVNNRTLELGEAYEALGRAERLAALGRLAAGVAHEINNPAAAVVTNLTYLETIAAKQSSLSKEAMEALRDSHESMERIARIVRQLLDTGRVASSAVKNAHAVNVADAVAEAVQTAHASVAKDLAITVDVSAELAVVGEPLTLGQVLVNLIANAAHAVRPNARESNGRIPRIEVRAVRRTHGTRKPGDKDSGTRVQITVADNGGGMAPDVARRMFEPFFSTKPFGAGTGLGLSVSLGLVRAVGGDIRIAETSDQGTTMMIELLEAAPGVPTITAVTPSVTGV
jgi:C4-dicarboxylate-specific signal transduction histidine kinase